MTRGNQRDTNRDRTLKERAAKSKSVPASEKESNKGLTLQQRKDRDAQALREKMERKAAAAGEAPK